jgi:predicted small integral membrane protein
MGQARAASHIKLELRGLVMTVRWTKLLLLAAVALYYTLVVFDNLTDFDSNYQFVRHVLSMDSTFPGNQGIWRAIHSPAMHLALYWTIILWEFASMVLAWWGVVNLFRALRLPSAVFNAQKRVAVIALASSVLMWLVAFLDVGGEWFMMWQSSIWNGQQQAFRMFAIVGLVLLLLIQTDVEEQA